MDTPSSLNKPGRRWLWRLIEGGVLLLMALALTAVYVWTAPIGFAWHLLHGNFTSFGGHKIRVPPDMWVNRPDDSSLSIIREASKYPLVHSPSGIVLIQRVHGPATDMSKNYAQIAQVNEKPPNGYRLRAVRQFSAEKGTAYCWELVTLDSSRLSVSCWFDKDTLAVEFHGSLEYHEKFYSIVADVARAASHPQS